MNSVRRSCAYLWDRDQPPDQQTVSNGETDLSSKLSSGWSEARVCVSQRLSDAVLLTVNIQAQPPQLGVKFTECIFNGLYRIRDRICLRRSSPIIWRGETVLLLYATKVAAACNSHIIRLYRRQCVKLFRSRYRWHRQILLVGGVSRAMAPSERVWRFLLEVGPAGPPVADANQTKAPKNNQATHGKDVRTSLKVHGVDGGI
jgi:hypothetical protein